jgi:hypothetical protein
MTKHICPLSLTSSAYALDTATQRIHRAEEHIILYRALLHRVLAENPTDFRTYLSRELQADIESALNWRKPQPPNLPK